MTVTYTIGDTRDVIATIPDGSISLIATSPPFIALRSYLPADHPDKHAEIGSEPDPATFIDTLLELTAEWGRVLAPWGSIAIELGDTFAGGAGDKVDGAGDKVDGGMERRLARAGYGGASERLDSIVPKAGNGWPRAKCLALVPQAYALSLAYGRNVLSGQPSPAGQWLVRNVITWHRPNPAVGCVDTSTEALTPDGWKRHNELNDGDLIAAYDPATDSCRFQPAKFVRWHRENEPLIAIEKRKTSQRLTLDHRCLVRTRKRPDPFVVLAGDLRNDQQMLLSARLEEVPGPDPTSAHRAELLGWYIAEGSPRNNQARIVQSLTANPTKVQRIRDLLIADGADFTESGYRRSSGKYGGHILVTFTIKGELAAWLNLHHKRLPMQYVTTWPTHTLAAMFAGLIDGDGHRRRDGGMLFFQKERPVCDAVQVLAIRLGLRATLTRQESMDGWQVTIGNPEQYESSRWTNVLKWDRPRGESIPTETYTGTVWCPMVESSFWLARRNGATFITGNSLGDKYRPSTSQIVVATRSAKRWFDLTAVRTAAQDQTQRNTNGPQSLAQRHETPGFDVRVNANPAGAPPLDAWFDEYDGTTDTWTLTTQPSKLAHYAMWPAKLAERLILSMCPAEVCAFCREPRRRMEGHTPEYAATRAQIGDFKKGHRPERGLNGTTQYTNDGKRHIECAENVTLGWSDCGCGVPFTPGTVLDPFAGTGTTLAVADLHGRDAIGIDIDTRNPALYDARRAECARNLFGSPIPDTAQLDLFGAPA